MDDYGHVCVNCAGVSFDFLLHFVAVNSAGSDFPYDAHVLCLFNCSATQLHAE